MTGLFISKNTSGRAAGAVALASLALLTMAAAPLKKGHERAIEHRFMSVKGGAVKLEAAVGSVEVATHGKPRIDYECVLRRTRGTRAEAEDLFDRLEFDFTEEGKTSVITMKWKKGQKPRNVNMSAKHRLLIPKDYPIDIRTSGGSIAGKNIGGNVKASTSGGSIQLGDINGSVNASSSGGSIRLGDINGDVNASTSGGGLNVEDVRGYAKLKTSGGSIKVGAVDGAVSAKTSGGSIRVERTSGPLEAKTSGGSIHAALTEQVENAVSLSTSGGSVTLEVPSDFRADLDASTSGGRVSCDLPITVSGKMSRRSIRGAVNGGGPKVTLRTSGGNVALKSR